MTDAAAEQRPFYGWVVLAVVASMYFVLSGALISSFSVFLPFLCKEFGWSRAYVSMANSATMIIIGLAAPLAGMFITRYGAKRAIVAGNLLSASCFAFLGFLSHQWQLFFAYGALFGLGCSLGGILVLTSVINNWFVKKRSLALGIIFTSAGLGGTVILPLLMKVINSLGWRSAYLMIAAATLLFLVILPGLLIRNKPEDLGQTPDGPVKQGEEVAKARRHDIYTTPVDFKVNEALRTPALWLLVGFATAHMLGTQGIMQHQVAFLMDIGVTSTLAATIMGMFTGISIVGRFGIGLMGLRFNARTLAIISFLFLIVGETLILFTYALPTYKMPMVFLYVTILGIGQGASLVAIFNLFPVYFGKTNYPKIYGYGKPFITIVGSLGAPVAGLIYDKTGSYKWEWVFSIFIFIIGLALIIIAKPPMHPSLKTSEAAIKA